MLIRSGIYGHSFAVKFNLGFILQVVLTSFYLLSDYVMAVNRAIRLPPSKQLLTADGEGYHVRLHC